MRGLTMRNYSTFAPILWIGGVFEVFYAALWLSEWFDLIVSNTGVDYRFGSEAMVGEGGFLYRSADLYAWYGFAVGSLAASIAIVTVYALLKKKMRAYPWLLAAIVAHVSLDLLIRSQPA